MTLRLEMVVTCRQKSTRSNWRSEPLDSQYIVGCDETNHHEGCNDLRQKLYICLTALPRTHQGTANRNFISFWTTLPKSYTSDHHDGSLPVCSKHQITTLNSAGKSSSMTLTDLFSSTRFVFGAAVLLRIGLLLWGIYQDAFSAFKYTDIDYFVFTDAARFVARGKSPYARDTYRYTPLLAWMLLPTTWGRIWFSFGKVLFAASDILAGYLILVVLRSSYRMSRERALNFASIWLLNPMVATISTRGSSEGLLGVLAAALVWAVTQRRIAVAGLILGFAVHFKIYPFIYAPSIIWWLDRDHLQLMPDQKPVAAQGDEMGLVAKTLRFFNPARITLALSSFAVFMALNVAMYLR
jgi:Mannosyltransferase (PIG-M)